MRWSGGIFINGQWYKRSLDNKAVADLKAKPDKIEIVFNSTVDYKNASTICSIWSFLQSNSIERIVNPDKAFDRIALACSNKKEVSLFVPWGVRPSNGMPTYSGGLFPEEAPEKTVLTQLFDFAATTQSFGISTRLMFMPADLYATEINRMNPDEVNGYFAVLEKTVRKMSARTEIVSVVTPWSALRNNFQNAYDALANEYTENVMREILPYGQLQRAFKSARTYNAAANTQEQTKAAFRYLRERLCEAAIVDTNFNAIKISCVDPMKDKKLDQDLPRLYIVPSCNRFPWLKPSLAGLTS